MAKGKEVRLNIPSPDMPGLTIKRLPTGKIVFKREGDECHYTVNFSDDLGLLDLHRTWETRRLGDPARHEQLFRIALADLATILNEVSVDLPQRILGLLKPIRIGWMARRRLGIMVMKQDSSANDVDAIKLRNADTTDEELHRWLDIPEYLDDIRNTPHVGALIHDCRRDPPVPFGLLFTIPVADGVVLLRWVKLKAVRCFMREQEHRLRDAFERVVGKPLPMARP
jgi:hypothetical protein